MRRHHQLALPRLRQNVLLHGETPWPLILRHWSLLVTTTNKQQLVYPRLHNFFRVIPEHLHASARLHGSLCLARTDYEYSKVWCEKEAVLNGLWLALASLLRRKADCCANTLQQAFFCRTGCRATGFCHLRLSGIIRVHDRMAGDYDAVHEPRLGAPVNQIGTT